MAGLITARNRRGAVVAGVTESMIRLVDVADAGKAGRDLARVIAGAVVHQDDFVIRIIDPA